MTWMTKLWLINRIHPTAKTRRVMRGAFNSIFEKIYEYKPKFFFYVDRITNPNKRELGIKIRDVVKALGIEYQHLDNDILKGTVKLMGFRKPSSAAYLTYYYLFIKNVPHIYIFGLDHFNNPAMHYVIQAKAKRPVPIPIEYYIL